MAGKIKSLARWSFIGSTVLLGVGFVLAMGFASDAGEMVMYRVENGLTDALGADAEVAGVHIDAGGLTLQGVSGTLWQGGIAFRLHTVRPEIDAARVLKNPEGSVEGVAVAGADILVQLAAVQRYVSGTTGAADTLVVSPAVPEVSSLPLERARLTNGRLRLVLTEGDTLTVTDLAGTLEAASGRPVVEGRGSLGEGTVSVVISPATSRVRVEFERLAGETLAGFLPRLGRNAARGASFDGHLDLDYTDRETPSAMVRVVAHDMTVSSSRVAEEPVHIPRLITEGRVEYDRTGRRWRVSEGTLSSGRASLQGEGTVQMKSGRVVVDASLTLPTTEAQDVVQSIPAAILGPLTELRLAGTLAGSLRLRADSRNLKRLKLDLEVEDGAEFVSIPAQFDPETFRRSFFHEVQEPDGTVYQLKTGPGTYNWTPLSRVSPFFLHAVMAHEDAAFLRHKGFAPWAIESAVAKNLQKKRFAFGASTITMQLAKNIYLKRDKVLARKAREVLLAWYLEKNLKKRDILELYVNVIEYGPGIYGIKNASRHYFGKAPADLTPAESVFLACALPAPKRYHAQRSQDRLWNGYRGQMDYLLRHMHRRGRIDAAALEYGRRELEEFSFSDPVELSDYGISRGTARGLPFAVAAIPEPAGYWAEGAQDEYDFD